MRRWNSKQLRDAVTLVQHCVLLSLLLENGERIIDPSNRNMTAQMVGVAESSVTAARDGRRIHESWTQGANVKLRALSVRVNEVIY